MAASANRQKLYFLAPTFEWSPDQIKLGSLITSEKTPHISRIDPIPIPPHSIYDREERFFNEVFDTNTGLSCGVLTGLKDIFNANVNSETTISRDKETRITGRKFHTASFEPPLEYVQESLADALKDPIMASYMKSKMFGIKRKLFMVTGVKTGQSIVVTPGRLLKSTEGKLVREEAYTPKPEEFRVIGYKVTQIIRKRKKDPQQKDVVGGVLMGGNLPRGNFAEEFELEPEDFDSGLAEFSTGNQINIDIIEKPVDIGENIDTPIKCTVNQ
ncbi:hypothetical protein TWF481_000053 [Arthrobotrys musiformis]|uniref:Uncharacterized protein n=1 Tax=Arthrobotrys musiformis TaxID=47236 RepID=A0AAV9WLL6_9PEZI